MNGKTVFCIPVRGGSRRIPRKNLLELGGETLIHRKVRQLLPLGTVVVGSDSDEMLEEARRTGAVAVRRRCTDEGRDSANDMIHEMMGLVEPLEPKTVVWCHCTNPFVSTDTYRRAVAEFERCIGEGYDSLVSVKEVREHLWRNDMRTPMYSVEQCRIRHICAGELEPIYQQNGAIFIQPYEKMAENSYFFGEKPELFVMSEYESFDINTPEDWICCQVLYEHGKENGLV